MPEQKNELKALIVNADDFGQNPAVNAGIVQAHERGIVTSASLMVRWPAAQEAAEYVRSHRTLGLGLHLDLGEWEYRDGEWRPLYEVVDMQDGTAVRTEIDRQIQAFEQLVGRRPTHIDSHQHVHRQPAVRGALLLAARRLDVPVRQVSVRYVGDFYGQDETGASQPEWVGVEHLRSILARVGPGLTEISCHPALAGTADTMYSSERLLELRTLCDPRVAATVSELGIELVTFASWWRWQTRAEPAATEVRPSYGTV